MVFYEGGMKFPLYGTVAFSYHRGGISFPLQRAVKAYPPEQV
jgi:hypothetical protein